MSDIILYTLLHVRYILYFVNSVYVNFKLVNFYLPSVYFTFSPSLTVSVNFILL